MFFALILLALIAGVILWVIGLYNGLVGLRNQVANSWKQIDVQLKRRHDLIPNLVNTVKGMMKFEQDTLERVMQARAKAVSAVGVGPKGQAEGELTQSLGRLFAVMEAYPEFKSNQNALQLQEELASTENKISFARQHYNDAVRLNNTAIETIPTSWIAPMAKVARRDYFELDPTDPSRNPVQVQF